MDSSNALQVCDVHWTNTFLLKYLSMAKKVGWPVAPRIAGSSGQYLPQ